ncbi:NAD-dependent epimerase/dehydratase family protein [Paenibacillus caseinilyticus]|uniref:NAD-dependent epimerase n=1 Tax=Paenibacillus mucilaginosus K02 TaxID=997761 RepID=I0BAG2_9BACL|nr:NAD(P)-dependent oxidoreductase [Paenibacillus mucilaginosus]AFH59359.1 NAD-dependent epimerase [Paenibacillus mucilaginosus K02]
MEHSKRLLITGAGGRIGSCLAEGLRAHGGYEVVAADLKEDKTAGILQLDVTDGERLKELAQGVDTIMHFAWAKDDGDFLGKVLPVNVTGAYHVYEAARLNGVKRVIFASSNHATGFYEVGEDVMPDEPYRPDSFYGLSKCHIELLGRYYADKYGVSSINLRIGNFPGDDQPHSERAAHIFISERDMISLAVCCIEAGPEIDFLSLYGTSANTDNYYDIGYLEELIGYKPQDDGRTLLEEARRRHVKIKDDETRFQGGAVEKEQPQNRR